MHTLTHIHLHPCAQDCGTVYLKVKFMPFFQPEFDDEDSCKAKPILPTMRTVTHNVPDKLKVQNAGGGRSGP